MKAFGKYRRWRKIAVVAVGLFMATGGFAQSVEATAGLGAVERVSLVSYENGHPAVIFSKDGRQMFVAWDGIVGGNRRIFLREMVEGEWLPPVIVDSNPAGNNTMPSLAVDASGVPHVAWISRVGGRRQPMYARRVSRYPNAWHQQVIPFPEDSTVSGGCDYLGLKVDGDDQPWVVWQYGFGNVYSIAASRYTEAGEFVSEELTPGADSHNIYPELFFREDPTVYWYLAQADRFFLISAEYSAEDRKWRVCAPENLESLPAHSLPDLFVTAHGPLGAIWYDELATADGDSRDRVFMGLENPETHGRGEMIPQNLQANNHSVSAASLGDDLVATWVSESYGLGSELSLGIGSSPGEMKSIVIRQSDDEVIGNPRVATASAKAAVVWEESAGPGQASSEIMVRVITSGE